MNLFLIPFPPLLTLIRSRSPLRLIVILISLVLLTGRPAHAAGVVGDGTAASCTETALAAALTGGGVVTFDCGPAPVTIIVSTPLIVKGGPDVTVDGGGMITLQANNSRIFQHNSTPSHKTILTLKNLTLTKGRLSGSPGDDGLKFTDPVGSAVYSYNGTGDHSQIPTLVIENVKFIDNDAGLTAFEDAHGGGAIFMRDGMVIVKNSTFSENDCRNCTGGAIHIMGGALVVENSEFTNNTATGSGIYGGGAIFVDSGWREDYSGDVTIEGSVFRDNRSHNSGGAIHLIPYRETNEILIDRSTFIDNASEGGEKGQGGAIFAYTSRSGITDDPGHGVVTITNSLFSGNWAKSASGVGLGGALWLVNTTVRVANSTIVNNIAYGDTDPNWDPKGGGMYLGSPRIQAEIRNSTIAYNHAGATGGGISIINGNGLLKNTIIAYNTANNAGQPNKFLQHCTKELVDGGNNLQYPPRLERESDVSCLAGKSDLEQRDLPDFQDPLLEPLADNGGPNQTMAIPTNSPAFDAGRACEATDQRGVIRPQGQACDIGAFELVVGLRLYPPFVQAGGDDFTLTVYGAGFTADSQVLVDGAARPTEFIGPTELRATLPAADIATVGELAVKVEEVDLPAVSLLVLEEIFRVNLPVVVQ